MPAILCLSRRDGKNTLNLRAIDAPLKSAMSIKRLHARIPAEESLIEFLVGLQLDKSLSSAPTPNWARGTSVEEIFGALRLLATANGWPAFMKDAEVMKAPTVG